MKLATQSMTKLMGSKLPQRMMVEIFTHLRRSPPRRHWKWALAVGFPSPCKCQFSLFKLFIK